MKHEPSFEIVQEKLSVTVVIEHRGRKFKRNFRHVVFAKEWVAKMKSYGVDDLPKGITIDFRMKATPFLARHSGNHKYFSELEPAVNWLAEETEMNGFATRYADFEPKGNYAENHQKFHHLYKIVGKRHDPCAYCGIAATTMDHVPSLSVAHAYNENGMTDRLVCVPSCSECNDMLSINTDHSITSRKSTLYHKYVNQYDNLLNDIRLVDTFAYRTIKERLSILGKE